MIPRLTVLAAAVVFHATAASAQPAFVVELTSADDPGPPPGRFATLQVSNRSDRTVGAAAIRARGGGPRYIWPLSIAPGGATRITVELPAGPGTQRYDVQLLDDPDTAADVLATLPAALDWGLLPQTDLQVDPALYRNHAAAVPTWSQSSRRAAMALAAGMILAVASVLLVRRRRLRAALLVGLAAGAMLIAGTLMRRTATLIVSQVPAPDAVGGTYVVVATTRNTVYTDGGPLWPIYAHESQMATDQAVARRGVGISVPIRPEELRIFWHPPVGTPPTTQGSTRPSSSSS